MKIDDDIDIEGLFLGSAGGTASPAEDDRPVPPRVDLAWNDGQVRSVRDVMEWRFDPDAPRFLKLTGPAGVGKTAVTQEIRRQLSGTKTAWSAMTGKAAMRLRDAVNIKVSTFHSALYHLPREVDNVVEKKIDLEFNRVKDMGHGSLLVVDEASMVGPRQVEDVDGSPYEKVLFIGDPYQLSPVLTRAEERSLGDFSVFSGISGPHMTRVMRNGGAVLRAATEVREAQRVPEWSAEEDGSTYDFVEAANQGDAVRRAVEAYLEDPEGHAIITWKNDVRTMANSIVRDRRGHRGVLPDPGEPLIIRKNYHSRGLMNGDVVRTEHVAESGPVLAGVKTRWIYVSDDVRGEILKLIVPEDFSGELPYVGLEKWKVACREAKLEEMVIPVTFAYCLTAHAAQGSQYRRVSVAVPGDFRSTNFTKPTRLPDGTESKFAYRFLYTAISRAVRRASLFLAR